MTDLAKLVDELSSLRLLEAVELAKLLEEKLRRPTGEPAATESKGLKFNEGLACEAIVRHLEGRENGVRADLRFPEEEGHQFPIEAAFKIGDQLYAVEHTGIEPFEGHVRMEAEAGRLFDPITDALNGNLDSTALVELHMPINVLQRLPNSEVRSIHKALIDWVKVTAPTIPKRPYPDYRGNAVGPIDVKGVPFPVTLVRFEPALIPGRHFDIRHTAVGIYQARTERMKRAIEKKFPKLAAWKRDHGAKTILVLEQNDIQLTNEAIVTDTFVPLATARTDQPDETYLVVSCMKPLWLGYPILIDDETFYDLARKKDAPVYWEIDQNALTPLTKR
jgi:hypothetical protein